jgi:hypothetical protein
LRRSGKPRRHPFHRIARVELGLLEHELTVGQMRKIEHVGDDVAQKLAAGVQCLRIFALRRPESGVQQQPAHPEDAV